MRLENKTSIITGASNGMGAAEARLFAREGSHVILADIQDNLGRELVENINQSGGSAEFFHLDVTRESDWEKLLRYLRDKFSKLDVLVNNAGISASSPDLLDIDIFDNVFRVNTRGVFLGMKYCLGMMMETGGGSIVNISSISGLVGQSYVHMGYSGSKGAVRLMTKSAAIQYAENGIRVNSVHPGIMPPMTTSELTGDPEFRKIMLEDVPMNRVGLVEEVANAVLFLASEEASYITGAE
ncbi:glucose 1-dehydrogenase, partial [Chloroflexi bacterium]|nr:glucose 1-dehydrogenase [Chloroflexota bacterium]